MSDEIISVNKISKKYQLGMIGGTSLKEELQRRAAKRKGLDDPTKKVTDTYAGNVGDIFYALDDISFTVKKGERVGIIGHNGAGKSTLLKLISRITAPTTGSIEMNGRVASMLEVGTGFHPELTGRENVYMNGAILGMTKAEIDSKIEDIIEFSECKQFIDTPVKRYSSGMYVKLAFAVAAHLDAEIMIMDEVLAVGDVAFQRKCLNKMNSLATEEERTILYVSHNMATIRQLCDRCIVLSNGKIVFNGNVEEGIACYYGESDSISPYKESATKKNGLGNKKAGLLSCTQLDTEGTEYTSFDTMKLRIEIEAACDLDNIILQILYMNRYSILLGSSFSGNVFNIKNGVNEINCSISLGHMTPSPYKADIRLCQKLTTGFYEELDRFNGAITYTIVQDRDLLDGNEWWHQKWGYAQYNDIELN